MLAVLAYCVRRSGFDLAADACSETFLSSGVASTRYRPNQKTSPICTGWHQRSLPIRTVRQDARGGWSGRSPASEFLLPPILLPSAPVEIKKTK